MTARLLLVGIVVLLPLQALGQFSTPRPIGDIELPETGRKGSPPPVVADDPPEPVVDASEEEVYIPGRKRAVPLLLDTTVPTANPAVPSAAEPAAVAAPVPSTAAPPSAPAVDASTASLPEAKKIPEIVLPPTDGHAQLAAAWSERRDAVQSKRFAEMQAAEKRLVELKGDLGIRNLYLYAGAVAREAEGLVPIDSAEALRRSLLAAELAPELPAAHWAVARAAFSDDLTNASRYLASMFDALRTSLRDPRWSRPMLADLLLSLLLALFTAGAAALLLVFVRHVRYFLHDFKHLFPRGAHVLQTTLLALLVLAMPLVFGLGPFAVLLTLAAAAWLYMDVRERIVVGIFLAGMGLVPVAAEHAVRFSAFQGTTAETVLRVERGGLETDALAQLEALAEQPAPKFEVLFALGHRARLSGEVDRALELLRRAAQLRPDSAQGLVELGNAQFLQGDLQGARESYQRASELAPGMSEVWFNLARLYTRKSQIVSREEAGAEVSRAQDAVRKAVQIDPKLAFLASSDIDYRANRFLASAALDSASLDALARDEVTGSSVGAQLRKRLLGSIPASIATVLPGLLVGLLALAGLAGRARIPSRPCGKCGRAVCRRCDEEVTGGGLCGQCVHVFTRRGAVDPPTRVAKEIGIRRYNRRRENLVKVASLVACGAGHVLSGRIGRGVTFLVLFVFLAVHLFYSRGLVQVPIGQAPLLFKLVPAALAALLVYVIAVRQAFAQFRTQGPQA